jgi:hypothetical protein
VVGFLPHLFGPAYVVAAVSLLVIGALYALKGWPPHFLPSGTTVDSSNLKDLFDHTLSDYKAGLAALDTNLSAQALVVATAVLVIIRRSDSLSFFGKFNSPELVARFHSNPAAVSVYGLREHLTQIDREPNAGRPTSLCVVPVPSRRGGD